MKLGTPVSQSVSQTDSQTVRYLGVYRVHMVIYGYLLVYWVYIGIYGYIGVYIKYIYKVY